MTTGRICSALVLATAIILAACENPSAVVNEHDHGNAAFARVSAGELSGLAKELRQSTSRFNSTVQAAKAGYVADDHCVEAPALGGMGYHWANFDLVDPVFDPLNPEVVLYAPAKNGKLELVAVEYIVINVGQPAPTFDGQPFDVGGTPVPVPHWSLHVWLHKENPNGLFTPFNPAVSCS
jgi:hypothetical protein